MKISAARFNILYGFLVASFILVLAAAFTLRGVLSWSVGLIYIAYDSFIQCLVVWVSSSSLKNNPDPAIPAPYGTRMPTVSVVVPARNEKAVLEECLGALFSQTRAPDEIIVVDDGSTDGTLDWLGERFSLKFDGGLAHSAVHSGLSVIRKGHTGKADSLNAGWRMAGSEVIVTVDADTMLEPQAVSEVARAVLQLPAQVSQVSNLPRSAGVDAAWAVAYGLCRWAYAEEMSGGSSTLGEIIENVWDAIKQAFRSLLP